MTTDQIEVNRRTCPPNSRLILTCCLVALLVACGGCRRGASTAKTKSTKSDTSQAASPAPGKRPEAPLDAMQRMVNAYQAASEYQDDAIVRLTFTEGQQAKSDEASSAVAMRRADNELRVAAYQVDFCCQDGRLRAKIQDPTTNDLDGQVLDVAAPSPITLDALNTDPVLADLLNRGMARSPIQLELLYGSAQLDFFLSDKIVKEWAPEETIDGHACWGVAIGNPSERFVFHIDKQNYLLRRLDYPTAQLAQSTAATGLRLSAEFRNAEFAADAERFDWQTPPNAKVVQYFVPPPQALPTSLYGKVVSDFQFQTLGNESMTHEQLRGKPAVMVWFSQHLACRATLQQISQVRAVWSDEEVSMFAICTEPQEFSNEQIKLLQRQWRVDLQILRDLDAFGRDVFGVPSLPTLVVLDGAGKLHAYDVGFNSNLAQELDLVLRMLKDGNDVSEQILQRSRNEEAAYRQDLISAGAKGIKADFPVSPRSDPTHVKLEHQWTSNSVKQPGNLVCYPHDGSFQIAILDGMRTVTILGPDGDVIESRELELPPNQGVTMLRSQATAGGRYYLAGSPGGDQIALFDSAWKRLLSYPSDPFHDGILDATLIPHGETLLTMVGFRGAGIHGVGSKGARLWTSRDCDSPTSMDAIETGEGWRVLATDPTGLLHVLTLDGKPLGQAIRAGGWPLFEVATGMFPHQTGAVLCGISYDALGQRVAVGLDLNLTEQWHYALPGGVYASPLRSTTSGLLMGTGHWAMAGPDGSVHLVRADGSLNDRFHYGELIQGLGITPDQRLIVATSNGVHCWEVKAIKAIKAIGQ